MHMDEFIDRLIRDEIFCDVTLPRVSKRFVLEEDGILDHRISALQI
jgi:pre-mRNA-splicing factor 38A